MPHFRVRSMRDPWVPVGIAGVFILAILGWIGFCKLVTYIFQLGPEHTKGWRSQYDPIWLLFGVVYLGICLCIVGLACWIAQKCRRNGYEALPADDGVGGVSDSTA